MSATRERGKGGPHTKYLPVKLKDFRPSEEDIEFAERFTDVANLLDECPSTERETLLLSTCRNQWMVVNATFVDLQGILGAARMDAPSARGFHDFSAGRPDKAVEAFNKAVALVAIIEQKLGCWDQREILVDQLRKTIEAPDRDLLERNRLEAWLDRQLEGPIIEGRIRKAQYLRLDLSEARCPQSLELVRRSTARLSAGLRIALRITRLIALAKRAAEGKDREEQSEPLFDLEAPEEESAARKRDRLAATEADIGAAWVNLREIALAHATELGFVVSGGGEGEEVELKGPGDERFTLPAELSEEISNRLDSELPVALKALMARSNKVITEVRDEVFEEFRPNVTEPPMPEPFVINFTLDEVAPSKKRVREFKVVSFDGRQVTQDVGRLALLECGMPDAAYSKARKGHIAYSQEHSGANCARRVALAAIEAARDLKADFLAMSEIFLPRGAVKEVKEAAEAAGVGLIAGIEYPERHGGPVNEALVHVPGLYEQLRQRKQSPSKEEVKSAAFESTGELAFVKRTTLGNLGVIVCSDLLELDVLWAMSSFDEKLDVVVVCAHNYHPEIFERLAVADATRLHALVAVVNTWTPRKGDTELPSGRGTLVAQPNFREPLLKLEEHPLPVDWEGEIAPPSLSIANLDIAGIRERELEKPGAHGYITPPRFARE